MNEPLSIIAVYVSYHSDEFINKFGVRHKQELGDKVIVVNSSTTGFELHQDLPYEVINISGNIGFAAANNVAIAQGLQDDPDYFLIINPDVYLPESWMSQVLKVLSDDSYAAAGIFTVPLLGYDFEQDRPTGMVDSLGIDHTWYGRWFDIAKGESDNSLNRGLAPHELPAACGALMLIRKEVVCALLETDGFVFNESYFMYKEDIELSVRVRRSGYKIMTIPGAPVFHCRGWATKRQESSYWARKLSARNELLMHMKYCRGYLPYSVFKYVYVTVIERFILVVKRFFDAH